MKPVLTPWRIEGRSSMALSLLASGQFVTLIYIALCFVYR
jgi:hypothetical protein